MKLSGKNTWICILFLLAGLVIGGLIGEVTSNIDYLWWLSYGQSFGILEPIILDLSVFKITFAITIKINIASIIGVIISAFIYRKTIK